MEKVTMRILGRIRTPFAEKFGVPRQAGMVPARGEIVFDAGFGPDAFEGLEGFSHLWVVFLFDRVGEDEVRLRVRPPRLGGNEKCGVFATRSPFRPNRIGLSAVQFEGWRSEGGRVIVEVSGVDLVDGTAVLDVKPYLPYADRIDGAAGAFAGALPEKLEVSVGEEARHAFAALPADARELIMATLAWDPRPAYHEGPRVYHSRLGGVEVDYSVEDRVCRVVGVRIPGE